MIRRELLAASLVTSVLFAACHPGLAPFPWPTSDDHRAFVHAQVRTLNKGYRRTQSGVLVREVDRPTRAALDYAAYHANFMIADPEPEDPPADKVQLDTSSPFEGVVEKGTLTGDIAKTPLTKKERAQPLAFAPAVEFLAARKVDGAEALEDVAAAIRNESWGLPGGPQFVRQVATELFLHEANPNEIWIRIELQPWFKGFSKPPDQDDDGFPEIYGRVRTDLVKPATTEFLKREYMGKELSPAEVKAWANQLSSYWYPSYNTDLIPVASSWPDETTEADIKKELAGRTFEAPTIVLRGKPQGKATYNVFIIKGVGSAMQAAAGSGGVTLAKTRPTPRPQATVDAIKRELTTKGGGSWDKWAAEVAPLHETIQKRLRATPAKIKGFAGTDGFLFYRNGLDFVVGGDLEAQPKGKNPLPVIVDFKKQLEARGVDFLFVPVPTKVEIFPEHLDPKQKALVGQVVNPFSRKFLLSLGQAGVEVVDLIPAFLAARVEGDAAAKEPLYQKQDTHWTDRGLRLTADLITARIKKYPWYRELSTHAKKFNSKQVTFTRYGDLHSRLPESQKKKYKPETLVAHQVYSPDGSLYDDDADSPIVVLGDSFTGIYQLTDAEHAGVSAHIAKGVGYPVDLVMSYGGGPNVRQKLMRRGIEALASKKLVVWIMTSRDLYNYWENWEPLKVK